MHRAIATCQDCSHEIASAPCDDDNDHETMGLAAGMVAGHREIYPDHTIVWERIDHDEHDQRIAAAKADDLALRLATRARLEEIHQLQTERQRERDNRLERGRRHD